MKNVSIKQKRNVSTKKKPNTSATKNDTKVSDDKESPSCRKMVLPSAELAGLWETLVFEGNIKADLLSSVEASLELAFRGVDLNLVGVNRMALLHGPPGTGKTSLCRALANTLAIRLTSDSDNFTRGVLVEVHSNSLCSMWVGESGKMVQRLFDEVREEMANPTTFVTVLIDEVESLTSARRSAASRLECSDSIRMVNTLLTQLDSLRASPNVLVLATSNLTGSIDRAFVDRADIKQYVGLPPLTAVRYMLDTAVQELVVKGVIMGEPRWSRKKVEEEEEALGRLAAFCHHHGFSGRTVRKLPFLALVQAGPPEGEGRQVAAFLATLGEAAERQVEERSQLDLSHNTA